MILPFCVRYEITLIVILVFDVIKQTHHHKDKWCHNTNPLRTLNTLIHGLNSSVISKIPLNNYTSSVSLKGYLNTTN